MGRHGRRKPLGSGGGSAPVGRMDRITPERRSALMARIRGRNTAPEMAVRRLAHALGCRFRLHRRDLPGTPDLVFPRLGKARIDAEGSTLLSVGSIH